MNDPGAVAQIAALIVAAVIGGALGAWRGVSGVRAKANEEVDRAMAAQRIRIDSLESENRALSNKVLLLESQVAQLRAELEIEKRITARLVKEDVA